MPACVVKNKYNMIKTQKEANYYVNTKSALI